MGGNVRGLRFFLPSSPSLKPQGVSSESFERPATLYSLHMTAALVDETLLMGGLVRPVRSFFPSSPRLKPQGIGFESLSRPVAFRMPHLQFPVSAGGDLPPIERL